MVNKKGKTPSVDEMLDHAKEVLKNGKETLEKVSLEKETEQDADSGYFEEDDD